MNRREWTPATIGHVRDLRENARVEGKPTEELASFRTVNSGASVVLQIGGEIDMLTTPRLRKELGELIGSRPAALVVDFAAVTFFASSGLAVLVEAGDAAAEAGVPLRLARLGRSVRRPLQITGLALRFEIYPDVDTALSPPSSPCR